MKLKLKCLEDCGFQQPYSKEIFHVKAGDVVVGMIRDGEEGIRIQQPDGSFSYPYYVSDIEELFTAIWEDK